MRKAIVASVLGLLIAAAPAAASHDADYASEKTLSKRDPRGDVSNKLDLVRVSFQGDGDGAATIVLRTRREWGCRYINRDVIHDGAVASVRWEINTNRDIYSERTAFFSCNDGRWALHWSDERVFEATRPDRRTLSVKLPLRKLRLDERRRLTFRAVSFANGQFGEHVYVEESDLSPVLKPLGRDR